jgi:hypothetical protein
MLHQLAFTYGFRVDYLEGNCLLQLFHRAQGGEDVNWAASSCRARAYDHQSDLYRLYHLPDLEVYALVLDLDGHWVRTFDSLPTLGQVARLLRATLTAQTTASHTPYIPAGSLKTGWNELEREVRLWWWGRLLHQLNHPQPASQLPDWPQRWADLLSELAPPGALE